VLVGVVDSWVFCGTCSGILCGWFGVPGVKVCCCRCVGVYLCDVAFWGCGGDTNGAGVGVF